ncbi:hypothetical protein J4455_00685 [Candidatus Woesearchaeota archaeon]|nr:hypothetical protein [Candidatus Woesearchaeota archaeon]
MKSRQIIIFAIVIIVVLAGILFLLNQSGNPIIPKSYDLKCKEKNSGNFITMGNSCEFVTDCQDWIIANCGPENSCNNEKMDCKNNKCVTIVYFRWDKTCV